MCSLIVFLFISCQNRAKSFQDSNKNIEVALEDKFFYLEFIYPKGSSKHLNTIELVKKELFYNGYIVSKDFDNEWQGVRKIAVDENITIQDTRKYYTDIHRFRAFSQYNSNDKEVEKIVITLNKPINDSIPNFNFRSYKKFGHENWQSVFNPGNFRFENRKTFDENEYVNWMIERITLLSFK